VNLAPELAKADISTDLVIVTPGANWPEKQLAFTARNSANPSRFVLAGCNTTGTDAEHPGTPTAQIDVGFRYVIIDLP
jgi:hypothetical protein